MSASITTFRVVTGRRKTRGPSALERQEAAAERKRRQAEGHALALKARRLALEQPQHCLFIGRMLDSLLEGDSDV